LKMVLRMSELRENVIEWITGDDHVSVTLTDRRYINKVRKLMDELDENERVFVENKDGSIFAHLPLEMVKLGKKRTVELSDEQKAAIAARLAAAREAKKG